MKTKSLSKGKRRVAGGAATASGINFQSAVTAFVYVHIARGCQLSWLKNLTVDVPVALEAETNGPGDDIKLYLKSGNTIEVQVKKGLRVGRRLWGPLIKLAKAITCGEIDYGVLVVSPSTSRTISENLCKDIARLADGRTDYLSPTATTFIGKLKAEKLPLAPVCRKIRIQTINAEPGNDAHTSVARSELSHLCSDSSQIQHAWNALCSDASTIIQQRGRRNVSTILQLLLANEIKLAEDTENKPALLLNRLCNWNLDRHRNFSIFGVQKLLEIDKAWIPLDVVIRDQKVESASNLAEALDQYHSWEKRYSSSNSTGINSQTLARFVKRVILIGGPGMGKTTLLKQIARRYSEERFPVLRVMLPQVVMRIRIGATFEEAVFSLALDGSGINASEIRDAAFQNLVLLCDGLDECGNFQDQIAENIFKFAEGHRHCRVIVTTRPLGYKAAHFSEWRHYNLKPLDSSSAKRNLSNLVANCAPIDSSLQDHDHAYEVCSGELKKNGIHDIVSRTPLMLGLAASIIVRGNKLGSSKEQLFEQVFALIEALPNVRSSEVPATASVLNYFLDTIGWEVVTKPLSSVPTILSECAKAFAEETGKSSLNAKSDTENFYSYWLESGLIEKVNFRGNETVTFIHKSFGEFAAARWVCSLESDRRREALSRIVHSSDYNEVLRFAGMLGQSDLVCELLMKDVSDDQKSANRISVAVELISFANSPPSKSVRESIFKVAVALIASKRCELALEAGCHLPAAARKFPSELAPLLEGLRNSDQEWTRLIVWSVLAATRAPYFNKQELVNALEDIAKKSGVIIKPSLGGGINLKIGGDHERELLERFLLDAAEVLLEAGEERDDKIVFNAFKVASLNLSWGFSIKANELGKSKGKCWNFGDFDAKKYLSLLQGGEDYDNAKNAKFGAIFDALDIYSVEHKNDNEPTELLYFSALLQATRFWDMPANEVWAWVENYDRDATREVIRSIVVISGLDIQKLNSDLVAARALLDVHGSSILYTLTIHVDPPEFRWSTGASINFDIDKLKKALFHPSKWIVMLAAYLISNSETSDSIRLIILRLFDSGRGLSLWASSLLLRELETQERLSITLERLSVDLVPGCEYLFDLLGEHDLLLEEKLYTAIQNGLSSDDNIAVEAAKVAYKVANPGDIRLISILHKAFEYWKKEENPYPKGGGVIPKSPRACLLKSLIKASDLGFDDLKTHTTDSRPDVQDVAIEEIVCCVSDSDGPRMEFLEDIDQEELSASILRKAIPDMGSFSQEEWDKIAILLTHKKPSIRFAAMTVLEAPAIDPVTVKTIARKLTSDVEQEIVDKAFRILEERGNRVPISSDGLL